MGVKKKLSGDVHFCNGEHHLACFAMLKFMKIAVKKAQLDLNLARKQGNKSC